MKFHLKRNQYFIQMNVFENAVYEYHFSVISFTSKLLEVMQIPSPPVQKQSHYRGYLGRPHPFQMVNDGLVFDDGLSQVEMRAHELLGCAARHQRGDRREADDVTSCFGKLGIEDTLLKQAAWKYSHTSNTVRCRYKAVKCLQYPCNRHPIALWDVYCKFKVWSTFCHCHRSAACNIVKNWTAL